MSIVTRIVTPSLSDLSPTGGATYTPAMMQHSTGSSFSKSISQTSNKITAVVRFNRASFTGNTREIIACAQSAQYRLGILAVSSDYTTDSNLADRVYVYSYSSTGSLLCRLITPLGYLDGNDHTLFYSFDADAGAATLIIDGVSADDTGNASRSAPTTGTLYSGILNTEVGASPSLDYTGRIGFFGLSDTYLTNWSDFMEANGHPIKQDETTWANSGWGSQPLFWNEHGEMSNNKGSAGNMTENGTIVVADAVDPAA